MFKKVVLFSVLVLALVVASFSPAQAAAKDAKVYVIHGINGQDLGSGMDFPVDINIAGVGCALTNFVFRDVAGPVALPAGTYQISISPANPGNPCGNAPALSAPFTFAKGKTYTVIAHLTGAGSPTASLFLNGTKNVGNFKSRIFLAHTAYAPAVDIYLTRDGSTKTLNNVENGVSAALNVKSGTWDIALKLAGTDTTVFNVTLPAMSRMAYFNYVVGSATNGLYLVGWSTPTK